MVLVKDIIKEGFIKFEDKSLKEISQEEYDQLIEGAYISQLKYCNGNVDPKLKEKYEQLEKRTKRLDKITNISIVENAILERRSFSKEYNTFLIVEDKKGVCLMYNLTSGEDHSFDHDKSLMMVDGRTKFHQLYSYNKKDIVDALDIGYMDEIKLYKNSVLTNIVSNVPLNNSDFIEFNDKLGNKIYLDLLFNNIYCRQNCYSLIKNNNTKIINIFKFHNETNFKPKQLKKFIFSFLKLFYEFED